VRRAAVAGCLLALLALAACQPAASTAVATAPTSAPFPQAAEIDAYLSGLAAKGQLSGAVLVSRDGMRFVAGYGLADRATGIANAAETRFRIGSNTKQFTAMAILLLQQRGRLRITDPVCRYVPDCPAAWAPITLRHLLTHTSGIPDYVNAPDLTSWWTQQQTPAQLLARFRDRPLEFAPGQRFRYSNSGYALLGFVLERVSRMPYGAFLEQNVFRPLGMRGTGVDVARPALPLHASGYYADGSRPDAYDPSVAYSAGDLFSTAGDLDTWDRAVRSRRLLAGPAADAMIALQQPCPPPGSRGGCDMATDLGYGYGWFVADDPLGRMIYHLGRIDGFVSLNGFFPGRHTDVVVLTNAETADTMGIGRQLAAMVNR
jgi:CubicO group peptidase (beta-lactamase class C family)